MSQIRKTTGRLWHKTYQRRKHILFAVLAIAAIHVLLVAGIIIGINKEMFGPLPDRNQLRLIENPAASEIYTADSILMGTYFYQNRMDLAENEVTGQIIDALIATEDIRFYNHNGIDVRSLFRVLIKTILLQNESSGGGSTITQQLAKNLYPRRQYPFASIVINKLREMIVAVKLEQLYTKREILMLYLNTVPFGEDTYGIRTGALRFFKKTPAQLNTEEIALLVGMLKGTDYYNPRKNYNRALVRRNVVLHQMSKYGYMEESKKDSLSKLPLNLNYYTIPDYSGIAPYFRAYIKPKISEILEKINEENGADYKIDTDGLKIYTTIDSRLQSYAEMAVKEQIMLLQKILDRQWQNVNWEKRSSLSQILKMKLAQTNPDSLQVKQNYSVFDWNEGKKDSVLTPVEAVKYNAMLLHAGFVLSENKTGNLKAWVGGINHEFFQFDHVLAKRQAGSTFKPFLYLAAMEKGFSPCDVFENRRYFYTQYDGWSPRNSNNDYEGMYSIKGALTHSVNTVSAKLISEVGVQPVIDIARKAGIESDLPPVPSLALGTAELSLLEMVHAYQTIANKGKRTKTNYILKITNKDEEVIYSAEEEKTAVSVSSEISAENTERLIEMLKNVVNQGTGARLRYQYHVNTDVAGKTGTTQNNGDGWFIGFTPEYTAGVRVGAEYPAVNLRYRYGQGAYTALPVWAKFFQKLYSDEHYGNLQKSRFPISENVSSTLDCEDYIKPPEIKMLRAEPTGRIKAEL